MALHSVRSAMLMSAGLGTRLRPFTNRLSKPILPLMGIPMAQFAVDRLAQSGVEHVVANIHHLPETTRSGLERLDWQGMSHSISDESRLLLGSAGGIRRALPLLGDKPFFLVNSDVLCDVDLGALALRHERMRERTGATVTLTIFPAGPEGGKYREIQVDYASGLITGLGALAERRPYFVGAAVIEPEALKDLAPDAPAEFVPSILEPAIRTGKAAAFLAQGFWLDIGSPELWLRAHLELIAKLESGRLDPVWRKRLDQGNRRMGSGVWVSSENIQRRYLIDWAGPCYWSSQDVSIPEIGDSPRALGPGAVLYGRIPAGANQRRFERGIGYGDDWIDVTS